MFLLNVALTASTSATFSASVDLIKGTGSLAVTWSLDQPAQGALTSAVGNVVTYLAPSGTATDVLRAVSIHDHRAEGVVYVAVHTASAVPIAYLTFVVSPSSPQWVGYQTTGMFRLEARDASNVLVNTSEQVLFYIDRGSYASSLMLSGGNATSPLDGATHAYQVPLTGGVYMGQFHVSGDDPGALGSLVAELASNYLISTNSTWWTYIVRGV